MGCFFLPCKDQQIFVNHSIPRKGKATRAAILFYPFGQEYMRAHKAFRQLANLLNRKNFDVYRFDYLGTGDSSGQAESTRFSDFQDSAQAIIEFVTQQAYGEVHLVGLRLGGLVAANCFGRYPELDHLVLWDPIADGQAFIDDCQRHSPRSQNDTELWNIHGYPLSPMFESDVLKHAIDISKRSPRQHVSLLVSHEYEALSRIKSLDNRQPTTCKVIPPENDWNYIDMVGSILMPTNLIAEIVTCLAHFKPEEA